ncbi:putative entry exclusion protein TrbK-alt [Bradyrhizobium elkanii]|jgi:conjugative transfer region protein TrbK|uniref:putative entry exclusion protein TrbK-alt n=1 Tax=Bradyrhizobium elkanii TaxID=29448 RepID=UPI00209E17F8|nr:putative entry exclusion protein TrbK-alt [Bradyrhizobium elkanii]MCP1931024.1 conjugative transfer region protein TrbK [Bradyrhizobium elkanii]
MDTKILARIGAIVFVAIAITATAIEATRKDRLPETWSPTRPTVAHPDPLGAELLRCQALGEAGPRDPACLHAWAESRNRFLAPGARPEERLPAAQPAPPPTSAPLPEAQ